MNFFLFAHCSRRINAIDFFLQDSVHFNDEEVMILRGGSLLILNWSWVLVQLSAVSDKYIDHNVTYKTIQDHNVLTKAELIIRKRFLTKVAVITRKRVNLQVPQYNENIKKKMP